MSYNYNVETIVLVSWRKRDVSMLSDIGEIRRVSGVPVANSVCSAEISPGNRLAVANEQRMTWFCQQEVIIGKVGSSLCPTLACLINSPAHMITASWPSTVLTLIASNPLAKTSIQMPDMDRIDADPCNCRSLTLQRIMHEVGCQDQVDFLPLFVLKLCISSIWWNTIEWQPEVAGIYYLELL